MDIEETCKKRGAVMRIESTQQEGNTNKYKMKCPKCGYITYVGVMYFS
jgi:phage terminase large subunit GpA-like protein